MSVAPDFKKNDPTSAELLLGSLRAAFQEQAFPDRAKGMQTYMKSKMPYWGVPMGPMRSLCKNLFKSFPLPSSDVLQETVLFLWRNATHREERYAAIELCSDKRALPFHTTLLLPMYQEMIVSGAWWDFVDAMAHLLGKILRNEPGPMKKAMLAWSVHENFWIRRGSILCQLDAKERTDLDLLYRCIESSLGSKEFFLQKAIGWALRQYAWHDPQEINRYLTLNQDRLSKLSYREAKKNLSALLAY